MGRGLQALTDQKQQWPYTACVHCYVLELSLLPKASVSFSGPTHSSDKVFDPESRGSLEVTKGDT